MKLSEIHLDRDLAMRFLKKRGPVFASFAIVFAFIGVVAWSFLFISHSLQKAFDVDQKKVQGEVPSIDLGAYERLKGTWKEFQGGKYVEPVSANANTAPVNVNASALDTNTNGSNANSTNTSATNLNSNTNTNQ